MKEPFARIRGLALSLQAWKGGRSATPGWLLTLVLLVGWLWEASIAPTSASGSRVQRLAWETASLQSLYTCPGSPAQCFTDVTPDNPSFDYANRLYEQGIVSGYNCGGAGEPCDPQNRPYYRPSNGVTRQQMAKYVDDARRLPGIHIDTPTEDQPIFAHTGVYSGTAIYGQSDTGNGITGQSSSDLLSGVVGTNTGQGTGVYGFSLGDAGFGYGVYGSSSRSQGIGVAGWSPGHIAVAGYTISGTAMYGENDTNGNAGLFIGNVQVNGTLSKSAGSFKIDDPTDPANKYLYHSFVESPDMMDLYNGNTTLDGRGEAWVEMPAWFQALNRDFRYQLTCIGGFAPIYVAQEIEANRFKIAGGKAGLKVSWQVTGIRHDPYADKHRIPVEQDKPDQERGLYLHPDLYGQPDSKMVGRVNGLGH